MKSTTISNHQRQTKPVKPHGFQEGDSPIQTELCMSLASESDRYVILTA